MMAYAKLQVVRGKDVVIVATHGKSRRNWGDGAGRNVYRMHFSLAVENESLAVRGPVGSFNQFVKFRHLPTLTAVDVKGF